MGYLYKKNFGTTNTLDRRGYKTKFSHRRWECNFELELYHKLEMFGRQFEIEAVTGGGNAWNYGTVGFSLKVLGFGFKVEIEIKRRIFSNRESMEYRGSDGSV